MIDNYEEFMKIIFGDSKYAYLDEPMYDYYKEYAEEVINLLNSNEVNNKDHIFIFDYRESPSVNGASFCENKTDKIEITRGVVERSYELFNNFITCFPDFKNFNMNNPKVGVKYILEMDKEYGFASYDLIVQIPQKKEQKEIAEFLTMTAVKFVILHEIGHIYDGHVSYLNTMKEMQKEISYLEYLTMEIDADAFAITRIIDEIMSKFINIEKSHDLYIISYEYDLIRILSNSIFGIMELMYNDYTDRKLIGERQLPIEIRVVNALGCINTNINRLNFVGLDKKYINECIWASVDILGDFYCNIYGKKADRDEFIKNIKEYNGKLDNDIRFTWKNLSKKLAKYARCKLAD